jgi:hypothetical protein
MGKMKEATTTTTTSQAVATQESNPWLDYGNSATGTRIVGQLLKFSKFGQWTAGQDNIEIPMGTRMIAHAIEIYVGWIKWQDNKPVEQLMHKLGDGIKPPSRAELGDTDSAAWDIGIDDRPRDPWQFSNYLVLMDDDGGLYTFATASKGGIQAVGSLAKAYGLRMRQHPNELPVVELGWDSYDHPNKAYGEIRYPVFEITSWVDRDAIDAVLLASQGSGGGEPDEPDDEPMPPTKPQPTKPQPTRPEPTRPQPAAQQAHTQAPNRKARF